MFNKIIKFFKGRSTFFALIFTVSGIVLAFMGKLTADFVALVGAIQGFVVTRAIADDHHKRGIKQLNQQEIKDTESHAS